MEEKAKRLAPLFETVRRLFLLSGNQCAFPGCHHPIISDDGTFVGELCHIKAAEEGGQRFDRGQSNEERRSFDNLLLLCHAHHAVTNDVQKYPVERMRQIKSDHESRFQKGLANILGGEGINIIDSIVALGGAGGAAPGAGGGGGGAIGPGARGGDGGAGGELKSGFIAIKGVKELKVRVGKGGIGGTLGGAGADAEDTVLDAVYEDGSVREVFRAKGGRGGASGAGRVEIESALLADSAAVHEGLLFMLGAGWNRYSVPSVPAVARFALAFVAKPDGASHGMVTFGLVDPGDRVVTSGQIHFDFKNGPVPHVVNFGVHVERTGTWTVVLSSASRDLIRLPFEVTAKSAVPTEAVASE